MLAILILFYYANRLYIMKYYAIRNENFQCFD